MEICSTCHKRATCHELCSEALSYADQDAGGGREIPGTDLSSSFDIDALPSTVSIFHSSPDHTYKREARAKVGDLGLSLKKEAAVMLLCSTDREYTIDEVEVITGVPKRQILYIGVKLGFGKSK